MLGETRKVSWTSTINFVGVSYSVPHPLVDETVSVRVDGDEIVMCPCPPGGASPKSRNIAEARPAAG